MDIHDINRQYTRDPAFAHLREEGSHFVPGEGPFDAPVLVIGEAPGRQEDQERRPFAGRSGGVLNRLLEIYGGIAREACYVTNVLKYRPPGNRDPEPDEVAASKPYVAREVVYIEPTVIVLVGRFALQLVFPDETISIAHGKPREYRGRMYLPTYHPAVALYNKAMVNDLRKDFAMLQVVMGSGGP